MSDRVKFQLGTEAKESLIDNSCGSKLLTFFLINQHWMSPLTAFAKSIAQFQMVSISMLFANLAVKRKNLAELGFDPVATGWEARMLLLCYGSPPPAFNAYFLVQSKMKLKDLVSTSFAGIEDTICSISSMGTRRSSDPARLRKKFHLESLEIEYLKLRHHSSHQKQTSKT